MSPETQSQVEAARREKLALLRERGIEPYAYRFARTHTAATARALFDPAHPDRAPAARVAGRLVAVRGHGRTMFGHVEDASGRIQVYFRRDDLGADRYDALALLDLGDFLGVGGRIFRTRTGEVTLRVDDWQLLTKAVRPLPLGKADASGEQHGTLADPELRARQRYADLAVHPDVRDVFRARSRVIATLRRFLDERGFLEVETPVLQPLYGGAAARPFVTHHHALDRRLYLRIATELYLKRCLVGGFERVYEIGKDFRNEGLDRLHNPEFTMLEVYEAYGDYEDMMTLTEALVHATVEELCGASVIERGGVTLDFTPPWPRRTYRDLVAAHAGLDLRDAADAELRAVLGGREVGDVEALSRPKLLDAVFKEFVEPTLHEPTLVLDFPIELSPLAKPKRGDPTLAERFEFFVAGRELANAFSELNDPDEQRRRFETQAAARRLGDEEAHQLDEDFLRALEYGMPPTAGMGLGVDRLVMLLVGRHHLRDVILFPMLREDGD